jgi:hypothetical protein
MYIFIQSDIINLKNFQYINVNNNQILFNILTDNGDENYIYYDLKSQKAAKAAVATIREAIKRKARYVEL